VLVLTRYAGESIRIGDDVTVTVLGARHSPVRLGVDAPRSIPVHRQEVYERIRTANASLTAADGRAEDERVFTFIAISGALSQVFRLCESLLHRRTARTFDRGEPLYEIGETARTVFLILRGVVKTVTATQPGREFIYHLRKDGDIVGELCVIDSVRRERAVALEKTEAIPICLEEFVTSLTEQPALLRQVLNLLCGRVAEAYDQVRRITDDRVLHGLIKVLRSLALALGQPSGRLVEIAVYLTQEELSQMVGAPRERVAIALNSLRRDGLVQYTQRGHLLLDLRAVEACGT
jgi:carbon storage regulator CsrA